MEYPKGFKELVKMSKKIPIKKSKSKLWENYCKMVFIGKGISFAESILIYNSLKKTLDFEYVSTIRGEKLENEIREVMMERRDNLKSYKPRMVITNLLDKLFFTVASIKGGCRFFKKKNLDKKIYELTKSHEKTENLVQDIVDDQDVPGIGYTKAILWLQSCGMATHMTAPTIHLKKFLNNYIGPYYKYNEDDKYFMEWAQKMKKDFKDTDLIYVAKSIFYFMTAKMYAPRGIKYYPSDFLKIIKKEKLTLKKIETDIIDIRKKDKILEIFSNSF